MVYGRVSVSGDAAGAVCGRTACHSLGSRTRVAEMTLSAPDYHHYYLKILLELAAAAAGVAGNDGRSVSLAGSNFPSNSAAD